MRLILFDDNPDFGGHQIMTRHALAGILELTDWQVLAVGDPSNIRNWQGWQDLARQWPLQLQLEEAPTRTRKLQALRNHFQLLANTQLLRQIRAYAPDMLLCSQGNIEQCSSVFRLVGRISCPLVSYIPLPHSHCEMGARFAAPRDWLCRTLYRKPDRFITLSPTLASALRAKGVQGPIDVVENGIPIENFPERPDRKQARRQLGLPENGFLWLLPGRTEFKQKGQDFALRVFTQRRLQHPDELMLFLGSGPDSAALDALAANLPGVLRLPWSDRPADILAAADALILPSRYEGVPLVMLEALAMARPVVASDRDGMRDWLPARWRFAYQDPHGALSALQNVRSANAREVTRLQQRVRSANTIRRFQEQFIKALELAL